MNLRSSLFVLPVLLAPVAGATAADIGFRPEHLHPEAQFAAGSPSSGPVAVAWYQSADAARRAAMVATEERAPAPLPRAWYHARLKLGGGDVHAEMAALRTVPRSAAVEQGTEAPRS